MAPNAVYRVILHSIVRSLLSMAGAWLVAHGLLDPGLVQDGATVVAYLIIDKVWELYVAHRAEIYRALYERWLLVLGIKADPGSAQPDVIRADARELARSGMVPVAEGPGPVVLTQDQGPQDQDQPPTTPPPTTPQIIIP